MTRDHRQKNYLARWISWLLLGLALLAFAGALALQGMGCGVLFDSSSLEPAVAYGLIMLPLNGLAFAVLGLLIITYHPENRFGWLASLYGFTIVWLFFAAGYGECNFEGRASLAGGDSAIWLGHSLGPIVFMLLALLPWLFPDGRFVTVRWRRVGLVWLSLVLVLVGLGAIWPGLMRVDPFGNNWIEKPFSLNISSPPWLDAIIARSATSIIMPFFLLGIISLVQRWRRSVGDMRQQIKWLAYHFAIVGTLFVAVEAVGLTFYPAIFGGWFYLFELLLFWLGLPVVIGLAIFKYRLYDIDIIIRKTLQYATVTALLALSYFGSVFLLQRMFSSLTGQQSPLVLVVSTVLIAALFAPLRRRIQDSIDRRFFRRKYDAQQVLANFARSTRDETDMDALLAELVRVVDETLQPEHVSVWLRPQRQRDVMEPPEFAS